MRIGVVFALVSVLATPRLARAEAVPAELEGVGIEERPGATVPLDVKLVDGTGRTRTLGEYARDGKPIVLVLAYYRCPMLCSLVINGLTNGLKDLDWSAGRDFRVVVVSFDPRDTAEIARDKRLNYVKEYGRPITDDGFELLVGEAPEVRRLAEAVGFNYRWDEKTAQFAHGAGAFVVTPGGKLSRTLYGAMFPAKDLRLALLEASEGKLGSAWDKVQLFCYQYDSSSRGYVLAAKRLMKAGGAATVVVLGIFLISLSRHGKRTRGAA